MLAASPWRGNKKQESGYFAACGDKAERADSLSLPLALPSLSSFSLSNSQTLISLHHSLPLPICLSPPTNATQPGRQHPHIDQIYRCPSEPTFRCLPEPSRASSPIHARVSRPPAHPPPQPCAGTRTHARKHAHTKAHTRNNNNDGELASCKYSVPGRGAVIGKM